MNLPPRSRRAAALLTALNFAACGLLHDAEEAAEEIAEDVAEDVADKLLPHESVPVVDQGQVGPHAAGVDEAAKGTVREMIRKLMDETRVVPDTAAKKGGPRGSPGSFAKLSPPQVDEFVSAIIKGAELFLPKGIKDEERWALVAAEISIESAFQVGTSGTNPGDHSKVSVGPLQLTLPGMWDDIFRQYASIPGLTHFDGSPWDTKSTDNEALKSSIYDGIIASLWCITEQGRRGCPDWFGGPDGPCPKTMRTSYVAWVIGGPALKSGGDLGSFDGSGGQKDAYIASISTDLKMLGFSETLIDTPF